MKPLRGRLLAGAALLLFLLFFGWYVPLPRIALLRFRAPRTTAFIEARRAALKREGRDHRIERTPVPLSKVSPALVAAVLAAEDANFYRHPGFDADAIRKARAYNARQEGKRRPRLRGASTITQQLAKNLYLSGDRTFVRKAREALIAVALEALLTKRQILEHYLSAIEWGPRTYGAEAAARRYFGKPASRLTPSEARWLAAMIPGPRFFLANPARHERRAARLARLMSRPGAPVPRLPVSEEDE